MKELRGPYPIFEAEREQALQEKGMVTVSLQESIEIANVFYYINIALAKKPGLIAKILSRKISLNESARLLHKGIFEKYTGLSKLLEENSRQQKDVSHD